MLEEKSLYLSRTELCGKLFPTTDKQITTSLQPLNLGSLKQIFECKPYWFTDSSSDYDNLAYTPVIVKAVLTNKGHTGVWLVDETDKEKVTLPGGHISEYNYEDDIKLGTINVVFNNLIRELYEEMFTSGRTLYDLTVYRDENPIIALKNVLLKKGFELLSTDINLYHYYSIPESTMSLTIVVPLEVEVINRYGNWATPSNMIWLDKLSFRASKRLTTRKQLVDRFGAYYKDDIRVNSHHRPILATIFNTEELF